MKPPPQSPEFEKFKLLMKEAQKRVPHRPVYVKDTKHDPWDDNLKIEELRERDKERET